MIHKALRNFEVPYFVQHSVDLPVKSPIKIGVVGCGALGTYYGSLLSRDNHEVHFLLRSDFEQVKRHGVRIKSPRGDFEVHPHAHRDPMKIGPCDLVLIGLKTTANGCLESLVSPLLEASTVVMTLQNGLGNEEALAKFVPASRIMGGLCFVCLNRVAPGVIRHIDHGLIVVGEYRHPPGSRLLQMVDLFRHAGIASRSTENLAQAHWEKLMWNIPFNGLGVAGILGHDGFESCSSRLKAVPAGGCLDANALLDDPAWSLRVRGLMDEVAAVATARGYVIDPALPEQLIVRTRSMGPYKASTLIDYERGAPLEMESLFCEPVRQAYGEGVSVPLLQRLILVLEELQCRQHDGSID